MTLTYNELRSNAERVADEDIKARVLRGIEVLNAWDPNWPDYIDPEVLLLSSPTQCVLGQLFDGVREIDAEKIEAFNAAQPNLAKTFTDGDIPMVAVAGYFKGLAVLDGDVLVAPADFGFDTDHAFQYEDLDDAWLTVLGEDN